MQQRNSQQFSINKYKDEKKTSFECFCLYGPTHCGQYRYCIPTPTGPDVIPVGNTGSQKHPRSHGKGHLVCCSHQWQQRRRPRSCVKRQPFHRDQIFSNAHSSESTSTSSSRFSSYYTPPDPGPRIHPLSFEGPVCRSSMIPCLAVPPNTTLCHAMPAKRMGSARGRGCSCTDMSASRLIVAASPFRSQSFWTSLAGAAWKRVHTFSAPPLQAHYGPAPTPLQVNRKIRPASHALRARRAQTTPRPLTCLFKTGAASRLPGLCVGILVVVEVAPPPIVISPRTVLHPCSLGQTAANS